LCNCVTITIQRALLHYFLINSRLAVAPGTVWLVTRSAGLDPVAKSGCASISSRPPRFVTTFPFLPRQRHLSLLPPLVTTATMPPSAATFHLLVAKNVKILRYVHVFDVTQFHGTDRSLGLPLRTRRNSYRVKFRLLRLAQPQNYSPSSPGLHRAILSTPRPSFAKPNAGTRAMALPPPFADSAPLLLRALRASDMTALCSRSLASQVPLIFLLAEPHSRLVCALT
jgi:hypothetical protein